MYVLAYAFLTTYQAYDLLDRIGSAEADVPHQIFLGTLVQSVVVVAASLVGGAFSDRTGRRKVFVFAAAIVYGLAMFAIAVASDFNGFLVGMAIGGLGFGVYMAVDLALVADVLPDRDKSAKDLGVLNIAGALPSSVARDRAGHPRDRWRQLWPAVRGRGCMRGARGRRDAARAGIR
jgi:MFS family permease